MSNFVLLGLRVFVAAENIGLSVQGSHIHHKVKESTPDERVVLQRILSSLLIHMYYCSVNTQNSICAVIAQVVLTSFSRQIEPQHIEQQCVGASPCLISSIGDHANSEPSQASSWPFQFDEVFGTEARALLTQARTAVISKVTAS